LRTVLVLWGCYNKISNIRRLINSNFSLTVLKIGRFNIEELANSVSGKGPLPHKWLSPVSSHGGRAKEPF
jgi:hypothetical protein